MEKISKNKSKFVREISLMKDMNKFCQPGFPRLYYHSSDKNNYYIVMEQLNHSLKDFRDLQEDKKFSLKTVTMIALQML
jgi:serine/threonine protein kinase